MILTEILEKNAIEYGNKIALVMRMGYRTVSLTYKDVYYLARQIAIFLEKQGLEKGDKVLLLAPNSPYWVCIFWGCLLRGYILVPLNVQSTTEIIRKIADQTEAKIIFKHLHYKEDLPANIKSYDIEFIKELIGEVRPPTEVEPPNSKISENDIVEIMYTSGTTGDPKGVILTHKNLYSNLEALSSIVPISSDDKFLSILPLSHIYEQMAGFLLPFFNASQVVYAHSPAAIRDLLKEHRITKMAAVPEFLRIVMSKIEAKAEEEGKKKLLEKMMNLSLKIGNRTIQRLIFHSVHKKFGGKLRLVSSGGAPLDPILEKKWSALGIDLLQGYGLTETSPIISTNTIKNHRFGSIGKILPGLEVKIAPDGEILVKGPNVFQGYYKNEEKTKAAFTSDHWFKTEDIGELDKDGFLFIKGRKKYMIKGPGAQNVYPEDIEFELNKFSSVKDSCVVGLEKPSGQVEIHAVVLPNIPLEVELPDIIEQANTKLAFYQQITGWSIWPGEDFPRSATRKVKKEEVLKWLRAKAAPPSFVPLSGTTEGRPLMQLLAEITDVSIEQIHSNTKIVQDLNLDSLMRIELVARIEEKFGVIIDEAKITSKTLISDLEEMIKKKESIEQKHPLENWPRSFLIFWLRTILQLFFVFPIFKIFIKLKVEGEENLKDFKLPVIFMSNHISFLDSAVVAMALPLKVRKKIVFAAAVDVLYTAYKNFAWIAELLFNAFPFPRQEYENIKFGLDYMGRLLDKGWSVIIYPEGRMSLTGKFQNLKRGAGLIAVEMDSFIAPVKINGTQNILPPGKIIPRRRGLVVVKFGKQVKFKKSDSYIEVTEKIQEIMKNL